MQKKNLFISMLCRDFHGWVVENLATKIPIGNFVAVTEMYAGDLSRFDDTFECGDVYRGFYHKFHRYRACPPIDDNLIRQMQPYDMEVLKMMDRHQGWKWSFEQRMQVYYSHIRFWNYILDVYQIHHAVFLNVPHEAFDYVIYCLCRLKGIQTHVFMMPYLFGSRSVLTDDFWKEQTAFQTYLSAFPFDTDVPDTALERYYEFRKAADAWSKKRRAFKSPAKWSTAKQVCRYMSYMDVRAWFESRYAGRIDLQKYVKEANSHRSGIAARLYYIKNRWKTAKLTRYYEKLSEPARKGEKYFYFALHYQPEETTAPQAGGIYSNQLIAIHLLAKSLPEGYRLYVKEHPSQTHVGRHTLLYDRIKRIENVRLISLKEDSYSLMRNAVAVSSMTGTVSIESVTSGIPCILFGKSYYNCMEGVFAVRTFAECRRAAASIIHGKAVIDQEKVKRFCAALYAYSSDVNIGYGEYDARENADKMTKMLCRVLE